MSRKNTHVVQYRRKRKGLTNYRMRLKLLLSEKPRLVVRKTLKNIIVQIIEYRKEGDRILASVSSNHLQSLGWKSSKQNIPSAYLVGLLIGKKAKEKNIKEMVLDMGYQKSIKGSRIYAVVKGVLDSGISIPHNKDMLPTVKRIRGEHIASYASAIKGDKENYSKRFGVYLKNGIEPEGFSEYFDKIKNKILGA